MQLPELHERAIETFGKYVSNVTDEQWTASTPCADWNVRDLVNHVASENMWVEPLLEGKTIDEVGDQFDGDVLGSDPKAAWDQSAKSAAAAVFRAGALDSQVHVSYGNIPAREYCEQRLTDLVVHGWDLARATNQDTNIEYDLLDAVWDATEGQEEAITQSGMFGSPIRTASDADKQTQLLAKLGRKDL